MIDKQVIHVPDLKTIGPYSQAVRAAGLLFVSEQLADGQVSRLEPITQEGLRPSGHSNRVCMVGLAFQVDDRPVFPTLLDAAKLQIHRSVSP